MYGRRVTACSRSWDEDRSIVLERLPAAIKTGRGWKPTPQQRRGIPGRTNLPCDAQEAAIASRLDQPGIYRPMKLLRVPHDTPGILAMLALVTPFSIRFLISASLPASLDFPTPLGRPGFFPLAFALDKATLVRSEIRSLSNSAMGIDFDPLLYGRQLHSLGQSAHSPVESLPRCFVLKGRVRRRSSDHLASRQKATRLSGVLLRNGAGYFQFQLSIDPPSPAVATGRNFILLVPVVLLVGGDPDIGDGF